jgi:hypothetical protein
MFLMLYTAMASAEVGMATVIAALQALPVEMLKLCTT